MRRRDLVGALCGAAALRPRRPLADTVRTIGVLMPGSKTRPGDVGLFDVLREALADLGWREGANLKVQLRWGDNDDARTRAYARELVELKPEVIVAPASSLPPVYEATRSIPIVFLLIADPVDQGFVSSLAHPGGNLTGFAYMEFSTGGKFVELLREIAPDTTRVLVLLDVDNRSTPQWWRSIESAAHVLGMEPQQSLVRGGADIDAAIHAFADTSRGGIIVAPESLFVTHRARLIALAASQRLPAVYATQSSAREGGLLSYSVDATDQFARAASYVDRILKGDKPGELPVQQPTKFELLVNIKTAEALGLTVPQSLLARADEVIE
jgi:putative tryptophan/tyrosine transport system substrate-binding protein